ncbi:MAG: lysA 2 [Cyanobacteria bacterium RYN_339]|nr:lysA 2 [Cyanobacteria bacterium RYN_339]
MPAPAIQSPPARELVARFGSPLYVYDAGQVRAAYRAFAGAFPYAPLDLHYAIVCNKNRYLVAALAAEGAGIHANTPGDAFAALEAGVPADRIVYSGTNLSADDFAFLLPRGIAMNLDSLDQLRDLGGRAPVGLRLLIDEPEAANRIGVTQAELPEALALATITRLHMYAGTNTLSPARFLACLDRLIAASDLLPDLEAIDLGGGFGVPYREGLPPLDLAALGHEVAERMEALSARRGRRIGLVVEPGRTLVAQAGTLYMTVVSVKERGGRRFVGVDSTVGNIVVPSVYHPYHRIEALEPRGGALDVPTDICGNTTHSRDFLGRDLRLPALQPGDLLAMHDVGAYGYAMSSHFLNRPRPAEVVLDGGNAILTTRREGFADLLSTWEAP